MRTGWGKAQKYKGMRVEKLERFGDDVYTHFDREGKVKSNNGLVLRFE